MAVQFAFRVLTATSFILTSFAIFAAAFVWDEFELDPDPGVCGQFQYCDTVSLQNERFRRAPISWVTCEWQCISIAKCEWGQPGNSSCSG